MSRPNTNAFLRAALNPPDRGKFRARDFEALAEVEAEDESLRPKLREPVIWPTPRFEHVDRPHYSTLLPEPLDEDSLKAEPTFYEVWVLDAKGKSSIRSRHRVAPKTYFGLSWSEFPDFDQLAFADEQSRLCAQRAGYEYLLEGARRVDIRSYRRKASSSRFQAGPVETNWVATMKNVGEKPWLFGEPTEKALEIDSDY